MKVSVIMPTIRPHFLQTAFDKFESQNYADKELIVPYCGLSLNLPTPTSEVKLIHSNDSVGNKRNIACEQSTGDIILHMDDDDYYAPDWISKSVEALINSKADCVGLSSGYFYQIPDRVLRYDYPKGCQPYVLGATMCYWRKTWERNQFKDTNRGEDTLFCANAGKVVAHDHINGFMAMLHGGNTSSHLQIDKKEFTPQDISIAKNILGTDFEKYVSLLCKSS